MKPWIVLQTAPSFDAYCAHRLHDQGLTVKFLTYLAQVFPHGRHRAMKQVLRPLFPSYIFVNLDPTTDPWVSYKYGHGVLDWIMKGERPAVLDPQSATKLFDHADPKGIVDLDKLLSNPFAKDRIVRVTHGTFEGQQGPILSKDGRRIRVALSLLGGQVDVILQEQDLEVVA